MAGIVRLSLRLFIIASLPEMASRAVPISLPFSVFSPSKVEEEFALILQRIENRELSSCNMKFYKQSNLLRDGAVEFYC